MRFLLGCLGVVFVVFGGCVLVVFSDGAAPDEIAFAVTAAIVLLSGIWMFYRALTMRPVSRPDNQRENGGHP
jgi:uncharacterized membrane protein